MKTDTIIMNLYGGPGTGKSTIMASLFARLKWDGVNCEMAPEFAKEKVWEGSLDTLDNQIYVFGKQYHAIHRLLGKVDVILTDSPLLLSLYYGSGQSEAFKALVAETHSSLNNINVFLRREKEYNPIGRLQTEDEAKGIDSAVFKVIQNHCRGDKYHEIAATEANIPILAQIIKNEMESKANVNGQ